MESCVPSGDNVGDCFLGYMGYPGQETCSNACLDGYSYDADLGCCAPEDGGGTPEFGCGLGYYYDTYYESCVPSDDGYSYPDCSEGYYYDTFEETCTPVPGFGDQSCSEGFYYNAFEETCLPVPDMDGGDESCSEGYYYDTGQESCVPVPMDGDEAYCPEEYMYDAGMETCVPYSEDGGGSLACQSATVTVVGCYESHRSPDGGDGLAGVACAASCGGNSQATCGACGCYWSAGKS